LKKAALWSIQQNIPAENITLYLEWGAFEYCLGQWTIVVAN